MVKNIFVTAAFAAVFCLSAPFAGAQDKVVQKIIELGQTDNHVMQHEDFIANRIGGRIVGSDALQGAEAWVAKQFKSWGYEVTVQEAGVMNVGFNRGPWFGKMLSADGMTLHFGTPSYTAGTRGPQRGHVVIEPRTRREFDKMKGTFKGAWVLIGGHSNGFAIDCTPAADQKRAEIIEKNEQVNARNMEAMRWNREHPDQPKEYEKPDETPALFYKEMVEAGALGFIQSAEVPIKILYDRANCNNLTIDNLPTVCDIKLDAQQYDIIYKKAASREEVILEFDIRNHFVEGPRPYHNILATLKGSRYPDEYVLAGGHLDAFDGATGAVDDAQGVSVAMEAARLLAASGAKPKRSIMFCIWTAEEFGLLGSKHFVESKTIPYDKISNYFNRDGGPECATSVTVIPSQYDDYVKAAEPVMNINPEFPFTVNKSTRPAGPRPTSAGGSDHAYFAMNGIPTVQLNLSDPKGYNFSYGEIWHSERDNWNRVYPEYLEHSAMVTAVIMYNIANLNHLLSREGLYND